METLALTFGSPLWLWALALVPALAALYLWSHIRSRALVGKIVAPRLRESLAGSVSRFRRSLRAGLVLAAMAAAILAMAQPRYGFIEREIKQKGRDIIVAVDTSRSMLATDISPTRLARAKLLTQDLIRLLKGDRVGLVAFAGSAFLQAPLTLDYSAVINALDELDTTVIPKGGTNLAAAIATAEQAFGKAEGQTRALIILTDGEELDADGLAAAKTAAAAGIRIFTVGIGSADGSLIPYRTDDGRQDFVRDASGKPVQSRLDESRLQELAKETGGFYVPIGPEAAREIFQKGIEPMDLAETGVFAARQPLERYQWPLGFAVALLAAWLLLGERRRAPARLAALLIALAPAASPAADPGLASYQSGNYEAAKSAFEDSLKSSPDSRESLFNAGAAAYKLGDFENAIARFTSSLLSEDKKLREDSAYNLGNALVRRGEAAKDNEAKKADWKNAIEQYSETLALNPANKPAEENREIVKKLLEDLEKQEEQKKDDQKKDDQKKDDQKKDDQKKDDQDQKDDQKKDQSQDQKDKEQDSKDQKNEQKDQGDQKDQKDQKDQQNQQDQKGGQNDQQKDQQEGKDEEKKDGKDQQEQKGDKEKDQDGQKGDQKKEESAGSQPTPKPTPQPTPGEKKEGDVKSHAGGDQKKEEEAAKQAAQAAAAAEEQEKDGQMSAAQARALLKSLNSEEEKVNLMQQPYTEETLRDW